MSGSSRSRFPSATWAISHSSRSCLESMVGPAEPLPSYMRRRRALLKGKPAPTRLGRAAPLCDNTRVSTNTLLRLTENGLYCEPGDFYIDPWRAVDRAVITHAH